MGAKIGQFLDNLQGQSTFGKLLLPLLCLLGIMIGINIFGSGIVYVSIIVGAALAFYLAVNIGANDVANNMGPAVGSKAISIGAAIIVAGIFEASGAIIAGGDVVQTIKGGIIDSASVEDPRVFIGIMLATLLGSALWINIATYTKSPVSATHSVIGGIIGASVMALGFGIVQWEKIYAILASWVISPVMGGIIAAFLLWSIDKTIIKRKSRHAAAKVWVPVYVALMVGSFVSYLILKGLKQIMHVSEISAFGIGILTAIVTYVIVKKLLVKYQSRYKNSKKSINSLFNFPLVFSAALLSFAHGANDVANAIGPFAAIYETLSSGSVVASAGIPLWIMVIGALGLVVGLAVYGSTLIKTVGNQITKLNQIRAFCVALSAAVTVIIASLLGLPVSSTHIAIGAILGIGFFREWEKKQHGNPKNYVDKSILKQILLAWIITLPASALLAGVSYTTIIYFMMMM